MTLSLLRASVEDAVRAVSFLRHEQALQFMESVSSLLAESFQKGNKVIVAGNGGSLCDAAHFAEELTGFFRAKRAPLPAIVLSEPGHITCTANDLGYDYVFSRGVEAFGQPGDIFIGLTTSGNSPSIVHAFQMAQTKKMHTVLFLGKGGGALKGLADFELNIEGFTTSDRIQEAHMAALHIIIEALEVKLFPQTQATSSMQFSQIGASAKS